MREESIGERLRAARVAKGYDLEQVVEESGVPAHYLLAMEMDQFKLLPADKVNTYLEQYGNAVDLDGVSLIHGYRNLKLSKEQAVTKPEKTAADKVATASPNPAVATSQPTAPVTPLVTSKLVKRSVQSRTRGSRHREKSKKSLLPLLMLSLLSLAILAFVAYITLQQRRTKTNPAPSSDYNLVASGSPSETANSPTSESTAPQSSLTVAGGEDSLTVTLTNPSPTVTLGFKLVNGDQTWVAASGTEFGEAGILLTAENPSYETTLPAGQTSTLITLGNKDTVAVTIDGQPVDLSALTVSLSYLTLNLQ